MTMRTTMADLVTTLRGMTNAGTADYTAGTVVYWTNDQLQSVLDQHRVDINYAAMESIPTYGAGTTTYTEYRSNVTWWENTPTLQTAGGVSAGTAYTFYPERGVVIFNADTGGSTIYITGHTYDVYRAAADVWRKKAAYYATAYDIKTDNHDLKRSQLRAMAIEQAIQFEAMAAPTVIEVSRYDVAD